MNDTGMLHSVLVGSLILLTALVLICLIRVILGPRYTDRVVALNMICTLVILMVCILSYLMDASYLVDVAILYGLLNLLAVMVLSRISVSYHRRKKEESL